MWDWVQSNAESINLVANVAMVVIWMTYLQLIYMGFKRANRAVVHIDAAVSQNADARCLVTNMGSDTVYLLGIRVTLEFAEDTRSALVTDRNDADHPWGGDFREGTNKGPLSGGEIWDVGSFRSIVKRAARHMGEEVEVEDCNALTITVVVASQQAHRLQGGYKQFDITHHKSGGLSVRSDDVLTRQIDGWRKRRELMQALSS